MTTSSKGEISEENISKQPVQIQATGENNSTASSAKETGKGKSASTPMPTPSKLAIILSVLALAFGAGGLVLGWLGFEKSNTPITFLSGGQDGNSANFTEGSIADIANKVSKSVVSIVTSTKTTNFFGQDYTGSAAGTGVIEVWYDWFYGIFELTSALPPTA